MQLITVLIRCESDNHLSTLLCCVGAVSVYSAVLLNTVLMPFWLKWNKLNTNYSFLKQSHAFVEQFWIINNPWRIKVFILLLRFDWKNFTFRIFQIWKFNLSNPIIFMLNFLNEKMITENEKLERCFLHIGWITMFTLWRFEENYSKEIKYCELKLFSGNFGY